MKNKKYYINFEGGKYRLLLICANIGDALDGEAYLPDTFLIDFPTLSEGFNDNIPLGLNLAGATSFNIDVQSLYDNDLTDIWEAIRDNGKFDDILLYPDEIRQHLVNKGMCIDGFSGMPNYWEIQYCDEIGEAWKTLHKFIQNNSSNDNKFIYSADNSKQKVNLYSVEKWALENTTADLISNYPPFPLIPTSTTSTNNKKNIIFDYYKTLTPYPNVNECRASYTLFADPVYNLKMFNASQIMDKYSFSVNLLVDYVSRGTTDYGGSNFKLPNPFQYITFYKQGVTRGIDKAEALTLDNVKIAIELQSPHYGNEKVQFGVVNSKQTAWDVLSRFYEAYLMRVSFNSEESSPYFRRSVINNSLNSNPINYGHLSEGGEIELTDLSGTFKLIQTKNQTLSSDDIALASEKRSGSLAQKSCINELFFNTMPTFKSAYKHLDWGARIAETVLQKEQKNNFPFWAICYAPDSELYIGIDANQLIKVHYCANYGAETLGLSDTAIDDAVDKANFRNVISKHQPYSLQFLVNKLLTEFLTNKKRFFIKTTIDLYEYSYLPILGDTYQLDFLDNIPQYSRSELPKIGILSAYELNIKENTCVCTFFTIG